MLLLTVSIVIAVPIIVGLILLALFIELSQQKREILSEVEVVEESELDLDKIVRDLLSNEVRRPLYRSWTKAGYIMESGE